MAKVFFISTGYVGTYILPTAPALFYSILTNAGNDMLLFDTTFYPELSENDDDKREEIGEVRETDYSVLEPLKVRKRSAEEDITDAINSFTPDVIMISLTEAMYDQVVKILGYISSHHILTVLGGVFPTVAPELMLAHDGVDIVCVGEGENAVVELCDRLDRGADYTDINNLYVKNKNGKIIKNHIAPLVDMDTLPVPNYSIFEEYRLYRPMAGKLYKMLPIDTGRGCPYKCAFCSVPAKCAMYKNGGFRSKSMKKIYEEIVCQLKRHSFDYIYFHTDTFLAISEYEFDEFVEMYSEIKTPFFMQTRAETITENKIKRLRDVGLQRMAFGIEQGNEEFRKKILNKHIDNKTIRKAVEIIHALSLPEGLSVCNMVGFPLETRELAMDTVILNHSIAKYLDSTSCYVFTPYHGTYLRKLAVDMGYLKDTVIASGSFLAPSLLDMPGFAKDEISGLRKCFTLYTRFDKSRWSEIKHAESNTPEGNKMFARLVEEYKNMSNDIYT